MYARTISELESQVHGYYTALGVHNISEGVPDMTHHFNTWLQSTTDWKGLNCGWGYAFDHNTPPDQNEFDLFFSFVDRFRQLRPTVTASVTLLPKHQPTGKRCVIGLDGRMDRPDQISAVCYVPTSLHHLRHQYGDSYVDDSFLMLGDGSHETTQDDLFDWVSDEFGVSPTEWKIVTDSTE